MLFILTVTMVVGRQEFLFVGVIMEFKSWEDRLNFIHTIIKYPNINPTSKLVLINLLHYEGRKDCCWPSQKTLMKDLNISQATLTRSLSELKESNIIEITKKDFKNTYKILPKSCSWDCSNMSTRLLKNEQSCKEEQLNRTTESAFRNVYISNLGFRDKPLIKIPHVPAQIKLLIDYYYSLELNKKIPTETTATFRTLVNTTKNILNGTIINGDHTLRDWKDHKFTLKEIKHSIDLHALALTDGYYPANKKHLRIHLHDFLYSPFTKYKSYMIKWLVEAPQKVPEYILNVGANGQPIIVNHIMKSQGWNKLPPLEMQKLAKASIWIYEYFMDNKKKWGKGSFLPTEGGISKVVIDAVKEKMEGREVKPGFYSSNFFLKDLLPEYCIKKGVMLK